MSKSKLISGSLAALLLCSCGSAGDSTEIRKAQSALLGGDTFLYFRCNATGWQPNPSTRLQPTSEPGVFVLTYDVNQPWMVRGHGAGDDCVFTETNQLDGWGSAQGYYSSVPIDVPASASLEARSQNPKNFRVTYPKLGRYSVRVEWPRRQFRVQEAEVPTSSLDLVQSGNASTVHAVRQDAAPPAGDRSITLPPLSENISISGDSGTLPHEIVADANGTDLRVRVNVPLGTTILRIDYDIADGSLPYEGRWYLRHPLSVDGPREVRIQLPSGASISRLDFPDLDPDPLKIRFQMTEAAEPFVVFTTPEVPDLYDHIETPHFVVNVAHAHERYQPAIVSLLENLYALYGTYTGQDVNEIQNQGRYSFSYPPAHWKWGDIEIPGGLSIKGLSTVNAALIPQIVLPASNGFNLLVAVTAHELGNGWWGAWEPADPENRTPGWINNEGHSGFLRAQGELDLGYCADARREHSGHYQDFARCTSECGGEIVLDSLQARFGWEPLRAFYSAVQAGIFDFRGMSELERSSVVIRFLAEQTKANLAPFFDAAKISMTQAVRDDIAARFPSVDVPLLADLECRPNRLRAVPNPLAVAVSDDATTARIDAYACGVGGWSATLTGKPGLSLSVPETNNCGTASITADLTQSGFGDVGQLTLLAPDLLGSPLPLPIALTALPNILQNGGFEQPFGANWSPVAFIGSATFERDGTSPHAGATALRIQAPEANDARMVQTVTVVPHARYRFSGWIRTENVALGLGANLTIESADGWSNTRGVSGTAAWTHVTLEFDSQSSTSIQAQARLGHYGSTSQGRAWFDDLRFERLH